MSAPDGWAVREWRGSADVLHRWRPPDEPVPTVDAMSVDAPALALGSAQDAVEVREDLAVGRGVDVVRRRSGGGAVLLVPGEHVWLDVWLPAGDRRWHDDVGLAADWVGAAWMEAAAGIGLEGLRVHRGAVTRSPWATRVCFVGAGPGEVFVGEDKLVGVSQRRTRDWIRFQCMVHRSWNADATFSLFRSSDRDTAHRLGGRVATIGELDIERPFLAALAST
ncbi:MAG: hypothetical protein AAF548_10660 [Actinomycetota bacterium]